MAARKKKSSRSVDRERKRASSALQKMHPVDRQRVGKRISAGKTFRQAVKEVAGEPGSFSTKKGGPIANPKGKSGNFSQAMHRLVSRSRKRQTESRRKKGR